MNGSILKGRLGDALLLLEAGARYCFFKFGNFSMLRLGPDMICTASYTLLHL